MGFIDNLRDDIEALFIGDYEAGVEQTSDISVVYIDPKEFKISAEDIKKARSYTYELTEDEKNVLIKTIEEDAKILRESLEEQRPGLTENMSDLELAEIVVGSKLGGPGVYKVEYEGEVLCMVNKPDDDFDEKDEIAAGLSGKTKEELGHIPGDSALLLRAIGIHEGTHCNQEIIDPDLPEDEQTIAAMTHEAKADKAVLDFLEQRDEHEVAQAYMDYRALRTSDDLVHATSALVDDPNIKATLSHLIAAENTVDLMIVSVAMENNIEVDDARKMLENDPEKFISTVEKALEGGRYRNVPEFEEYIQNFTGAYRRQIIEPDPVDPSVFTAGPMALNEIDGGKPVIVAGDLKDSMEIGGVPASAYFSSYADPALAQERLAMENRLAAENNGPQQQIAASPVISPDSAMA